MNLQLIDRKKLRFRVNKVEYDFVKPKYLMPLNEFRLIEAKVKGSTMCFNIQGETITYNQIKEICEKI